MEKIKMEASARKEEKKTHVQGGVMAIPQSGLRHAVALEKLMNSNDSQDSVLRDLKAMVGSNDNSMAKLMGSID